MKEVRCTYDERIAALRDIAIKAKSPLSIMEIGLVAEYGQTGSPLPFSEYMLIKNIWDVLNEVMPCSLESISRLVENRSTGDLDSVTEATREWVKRLHC